MKYKEVVEGFEMSPSDERKGVKHFLKKNRYAVVVVVVLLAAGGAYYYSKKQKR
jgi:hypothetical protein